MPVIRPKSALANPTVKGETSAIYFSQQLEHTGVKFTRIAIGILVGSEIEYADEMTTLKAIGRPTGV